MYKFAKKAIAFILVFLTAFGTPVAIGPLSLNSSGTTVYAAGNATVTKVGSTWTLENDSLKSVISFSSGSIDMTSFYNKLSSTEYLTGGGTRHLFS
jgi:hypothetical protein